ncbi:MAG TPA: hypothetical protein VHX90_06470 [Verrucomicrobiae bacterium]|nr:hypothetical protein [Verrucomicrobiae bacterium]
MSWRRSTVALPEIVEIVGKLKEIGQSHREATALRLDAMASLCDTMALYRRAMELRLRALASSREAVALRAGAMSSFREAVALCGMTIESCGQITREGWTNAVQAKRDFSADF